MSRRDAIRSSDRTEHSEWSLFRAVQQFVYLLLVFVPIVADTPSVDLQRDYIIIGCVGVAVAMLDQATKWLAELVPSWPIVDATRSGAKLFNGADPDMLWATPIALVASAALLLLAFGLHQAERLSWPAVAIVGAGVAGTMIDLVAFGSMRTWFAVGPTRWSLSLLCLVVAAPFLVRGTVSILRPDSASSPTEITTNVEGRHGPSEVHG